MKLGTRIFLAYTLVFLLLFYGSIGWFQDNLRVRYLESVEEPMVDFANILASLVGMQIKDGTFDSGRLRRSFDETYERDLNALIYDFAKNKVDSGVYLTDENGVILFDSINPENAGLDYSYRRDVLLTLKGRYGARTTRAAQENPESSVLFVAAPVKVDGSTVGVLTLSEPTTTINSFLHLARPHILAASLAALVVALAVSYLFSLWVTLPIKRLTAYAQAVGTGRRIPFPRLDKSEIGAMGRAFRKMQEALEGKKYVENYVQNLTHEIKGPLSAIRGAGELLEEDMPPEQRARFLANIREQSQRIQLIVDRMLALAGLEKQSSLEKKEKIDFGSLIKNVLESKRPFLVQKKLETFLDIRRESLIQGDSFLLFQALSNLLQNAIDFSPEAGRIEMAAANEGRFLVFTVKDSGPGVPDYALTKAFEKFFSLKRPDSGKKSTGLGLNFVKEVADLHGGSVSLANHDEAGALATLRLPLAS